MSIIMGHHLPSELLHNIFIQLPLGQRVKCLLVCRHWFEVLNNRSLLYNVVLDSRYRFVGFLETLRRSPIRAFQVEILIIARTFRMAFDKRAFLNVVPNLRVFKLHDSSEQEFFDQPFEHVIPDTRLEQVKDYGMCEFTRQLTLTGTCTRLERLNLTLSTQFKNPRRDLFPYLKDMPVLKKLTIWNNRIGIQDCEILHTNLPSLERFLLQELDLDAGPLPRNITPATCLTSLTVFFDNVHNFTEHPNWYIYMAHKYPNLKTLSHIDMCMEVANLEHTMVIYRDGILPLYRNIGTRLHHFDAKNVPTELEVFKQLDDIGCRFSLCRLEYNETRPLFAQLAQSNQARYLEELEIENTIIDSPSLLGNMTSLTKLTIDMTYEDAYWPINLTEYINAFPPTLKIFLACCTDLEISEIPARSTSIKELKIRCSSSLPKQFGQVVSTCLPHLNDLTLTCPVTENITIDMPALHFENLVLTTSFGEEPHGFSIETTSNSQVKHYLGSLDPEHSYFYYPILPATAQELQNKVTLKIICASAKDPSLSTIK